MVTLTASAALDPEKPFIIPLPHQALLDDLNVGERLLLDDRQLEFVVARGTAPMCVARWSLADAASSHKG